MTTEDAFASTYQQRVLKKIKTIIREWFTIILHKKIDSMYHSSSQQHLITWIPYCWISMVYWISIVTEQDCYTTVSSQHFLPSRCKSSFMEWTSGVIAIVLPCGLVLSIIPAYTSIVFTKFSPHTVMEWEVTEQWNNSRKKKEKWHSHSYDR